MGFNIDNIKFEEDHIRDKFNKSKSLKIIYRAMKSVERHANFEAGMVLVCRKRNGKLLTNTTGTPQKWIVANKMADVLCLCRRVGINGNIGKGIEVIAEYDPDEYIFEEDPDVADAILWGLEDDPLGMPKKIGKIRSKIKKYNNNIGTENFFKNNVFSSSTGRTNESILSYIEGLILRSPNGKWTIWKMENELSKSKHEVYEVDRSKTIIWSMSNGRKTQINIWNICRSYYGSGFYIEEPKTIKEELDKS